VREWATRGDIVEVGKRMYAKGFVAANDGNISVRLSDDAVMITPTGVSKGYMNPEDMIITDMQGQVVDGTKKPSSEIKMHLEVYRNRPDVHAVCHAHPQKATAFAVARKVCQQVALPEVIFSIGSVALADYATPSTQQLPDSIRDIVKTTDAILLANHGALTVGSDVFDAYYKMETLEHFAGIILYARMLGGEQGLTPDQINELLRVRRDVFGKKDLGYLGDGYCGGRDIDTAAGHTGNEEDLVEAITQAVMARLGMH
jgi:L-fuculose-phosphate aldolase